MSATTWIDVADTAVKIGLGAIIGGLMGIWLAKLAAKNSRVAKLDEHRRSTINEILKSIDEFGHTTSLYWANLINAVKTLEDGGRVYKAEKDALKVQEQKLFHDFTIVSSCRAKLQLIGCKNAVRKLDNYSEPIREFFKIGYLGNKKCTYGYLLDFKEKTSINRERFYQSLNEEYYKLDVYEKKATK